MACGKRSRGICLSRRRWKAAATHRLAQLPIHEDIHTVGAHWPVAGQSRLRGNLFHNHWELHLRGTGGGGWCVAGPPSLWGLLAGRATASPALSSIRCCSVFLPRWPRFSPNTGTYSNNFCERGKRKVRMSRQARGQGTNAGVTTPRPNHTGESSALSAVLATHRGCSAQPAQRKDEAGVKRGI